MSEISCGDSPSPPRRGPLLGLQPGIPFRDCPLERACLRRQARPSGAFELIEFFHEFLAGVVGVAGGNKGMNLAVILPPY